MKTRTKQIGTFACVAIAALVISQSAEARELVQAASQWTDTAKSLAKVLGVAGILTGTVVMQFPGGASFGKKMLATGIFGTVCAFGASSFLSLLQQVFGTL